MQVPCLIFRNSNPVGKGWSQEIWIVVTSLSHLKAWAHILLKCHFLLEALPNPLSFLQLLPSIVLILIICILALATLRRVCPASSPPLLPLEVSQSRIPTMLLFLFLLQGSEYCNPSFIFVEWINQWMTESGQMVHCFWKWKVKMGSDPWCSGVSAETLWIPLPRGTLIFGFF